MTATRQQTIDTIRSNAELVDAINSRSITITVWSQADDGEWHARTFGNEAAAQEFEAKGRKRGFATTREEPR